MPEDYDPVKAAEDWLHSPDSGDLSLEELAIIVDFTKGLLKKIEEKK